MFYFVHFYVYRILFIGLSTYPYVSWRLLDLKTYNFLYALYVGRAEEAIHYLSRLETDYQLTSQIQSQRVLIQPVSANPYPSRPAFVCS